LQLRCRILFFPANDVRIDEAIAQQYQISGVPYFIINQKYAISGAQHQYKKDRFHPLKKVLAT
jgi:protein-disulfide isomerase